MKLQRITLLNSSILTSYGTFSFRPLTLAEARQIVADGNEVQSAIGHASTAAILSDLLDFPIRQARIEYIQKTGEAALIFKLKKRPPEGTVLSRAEIEEIGYEFGLLKKLD